MKKGFVLMLALALLAMTACGGGAVADTSAATTVETTTEPTQTPEEEKALKIMIIGNSHSHDTFWLLHKVFADQMPDQEVVLGVMYYSGCTVDQHVTFSEQKQAVYTYFRNSEGTWDRIEQSTMDYGLRDQAWDIIVFQGGRDDGENEYNLKGRRALEAIVKEHVAQPYKMMWQITWPSPDDPTFFSADYPVKASAGWVEYLEKYYGHDTFYQFKVMVEKTKPYLLEDETYEKVISTGAGVMYAHAARNVPQLELWRDYAHLSDYGRLIAAYTFYAQFTGNPVTEINIDVIPTALREKRSQAKGDLIITEEMKQVIMDSANHVLEDPWTAPERPAAAN